MTATSRAEDSRINLNDKQTRLKYTQECLDVIEILHAWVSGPKSAELIDALIQWKRGKI